MLILGVNSYFEHPSVALVHNGRIVFAAEDERFTGIKHGRRYNPFNGYLPIAAIHAALKHTGVTSADIDEIAYSYSGWDHLKSLSGCFTGSRLSSFRDEFSAFISLMNLPHALRSGYEIPQRYRERLRPEDFRDVPFTQWNHHQCHAASAFFCSGWQEALVIVVDGAGENACTSIFIGKGKSLTLIGENVLPHSLGHFYSFVTQHLGFEPFSDEFKVMGLAAYGNPRFLHIFDRIIQTLPDGGYRVDLKALQNLGDCLPPARSPGGSIEQVHKDIARSAQARLEQVLVHIVSHYAAKTGLQHLCLAGGTFLNCVANGKVASLRLFKEIFVQPASSDAGTAIGAAALSSIRSGGPAQLNYDSFSLGTEYSDDFIGKILKQAGVAADHLTEDQLIDRLAHKLSNNKVCAVFRGRMEFGPRALGMRSLFASPLQKEARDILNEIKDRESFRPVAPITTAVAFRKYFNGHQDSYMLFTSDVVSDARTSISGAVHVDGTARVQVVKSQEDPFLHGLLEAFGAITGHPVIINTSFNVKGKPIVEHPADALACFYTSRLDCLVLGGYFLEKGLN